jgi:hypothetical protein
MKQIKIVLMAVYAIGLAACASAQGPVSGILYSDVKSGVTATEAYGGTARGEACASSILGAIATGDASIDAAKKNGGIAQVTAVDHTNSNIFVFYAKYCTVVYGKKAAASASPGTPAATPVAKPAG